ncbi:MAG TPA: hypothetical protein VHH91_13460 [Vicinamibacterales bacterium]|nr:hypothetical protein [Vicinamibacterales bacterium]
MKFPEMSAAAVREQIRAAIVEAGPQKLLVAPGCAIPSFSFPELIRAAQAEVDKT